MIIYRPMEKLHFDDDLIEHYSDNLIRKSTVEPVGKGAPVV